MSKEFNKVFPLMDVENDLILSKRGEITLTFRVSLPEIFSLSDREYESLHQCWIRALRVLPSGSIMHKQDWFMTRRYQGDSSKAEDCFLEKSSDAHFKGRPYLDHECYIMLSKTPASSKGTSSLFSSLLRGNLVPVETIDRNGFDDFLGACGQFQRILEDSGLIQLEQLKDDELASNPSRLGLIERYCQLGSSTTQPMIRDIDFSKGIQVGDNHCHLYTISDSGELPSLCGSRIDFDRYSTDNSRVSLGFNSPLGQLLNCNHICNQYILIPDSQKTLKHLERKRLRLQSLSAYSRQNRITRDATNDFLNEAISKQRLPVKAHFNVLVWASELQELPNIKNLVCAAMSKMDVICKQETVGAPQIFWAGIPGNSADLPINETFDTFAEQASCFLNLETNSSTSLSPTGIRLGDRLTGRPLHVDISDEPIQKGICTNRNKFILGPTGSGKSFFTNHMLRSYHQQGSHVVLVDVGHSYKGLCEFSGGQYLTYSEEEPIMFNPFFIGEGDTLDTEKKESIKTLLLALWKKDDETYKRSEYVALSNAITGYFEFLATNPEIWPCFDSFYDYLRNIYVQSVKNNGVKASDFDIDNFLFVLRPFYRGGEFDYLLNSNQKLNLLQERFIVFELEEIKGAHVAAA